MDVDLDIDNYDLEDILQLFKLDYNFDEKDLRNAKKAALKSHPDKSNLDMKYFFLATIWQLLKHLFIQVFAKYLKFIWLGSEARRRHA